MEPDIPDQSTGRLHTLQQRAPVAVESVVQLEYPMDRTLLSMNHLATFDADQLLNYIEPQLDNPAAVMGEALEVDMAQRRRSSGSTPSAAGSSTPSAAGGLSATLADAMELAARRSAAELATGRSKAAFPGTIPAAGSTAVASVVCLVSSGTSSSSSASTTVSVSSCVKTHPGSSSVNSAATLPGSRSELSIMIERYFIAPFKSDEGYLATPTTSAERDPAFTSTSAERYPGFPSMSSERYPDLPSTSPERYPAVPSTSSERYPDVPSTSSKGYLPIPSPSSEWLTPFPPTSFDRYPPFSSTSPEKYPHFPPEKYPHFRSERYPHFPSERYQHFPSASESCPPLPSTSSEEYPASTSSGEDSPFQSTSFEEDPPFPSMSSEGYQPFPSTSSEGYPASTSTSEGHRGTPEPPSSSPSASVHTLAPPSQLHHQRPTPASMTSAATPSVGGGSGERDRSRHSTPARLRPRGRHEEEKGDDKDPEHMQTLPADIRRSKRRKKCVQCRRELWEVTLLPCGHFVLCAGCGEDANICPVCRQAVISVVRTFKS